MNTILIGERINSSNRKVRALLEAGDGEAILEIARRQVIAGADFIDINCSMLMEGEGEAMLSTGRAVLGELGTKIAVDSPDTGILLRGAEAFGSDCILNSMTCGEDDMEAVIPTLGATGASVIVMTKDGAGIPGSHRDRVSLARKAVARMRDAGLDDGRIFLDPVFSPVATGSAGLSEALETLRLLRGEFPGCHRVGGLSNISYGMPGRRNLNRAFLAVAVEAGLSAVICDVTDTVLLDTLAAAEAVTGIDRGCRGYLGRYREKKSRDA